MPPPPFPRRWPQCHMFVLENRRIMYQPIAKNACSSLKSLMVELSGHPDRDEILKNVHVNTGQRDTGLLLKDFDEGAAHGVLAEPGYFRFTVLRAPLERLLSAYTEKFVTNRRRPYQHYATAPVVAAVQGRDRPEDADHETGITFRQFAEHVIAQPPARLDPHWRPQMDNLTAAGFDHVYTVGGLDLLAEDLARHCGEPVRIGHRNRSRGGSLAHEPGAADRLPGEIEDRVQRIDTASFYDGDLAARVAAYYATDHTMFRAAEAAETARRAATGRPAPTAARVRTPLERRLRKALSLNGLRRAVGIARPVR